MFCEVFEVHIQMSDEMWPRNITQKIVRQEIVK